MLVFVFSLIKTEAKQLTGSHKTPSWYCLACAATDNELTISLASYKICNNAFRGAFLHLFPMGDNLQILYLV